MRTKRALIGCGFFGVLAMSGVAVAEEQAQSPSAGGSGDMQQAERLAGCNGGDPSALLKAAQDMAASRGRTTAAILGETYTRCLQLKAAAPNINNSATASGGSTGPVTVTANPTATASPVVVSESSSSAYAAAQAAAQARAAADQRAAMFADLAASARFMFWQYEGTPMLRGMSWVSTTIATGVGFAPNPVPGMPEWTAHVQPGFGVRVPATPLVLRVTFQIRFMGDRYDIFSRQKLSAKDYTLGFGGELEYHFLRNADVPLILALGYLNDLYVQDFNADLGVPRHHVTFAATTWPAKLRQVLGFKFMVDLGVRPEDLRNPAPTYSFSLVFADPTKLTGFAL